MSHLGLSEVEMSVGVWASLKNKKNLHFVLILRLLSQSFGKVNKVATCKI
jgi:hypothetical protein